MKESETFYPANQQEWREWLQENHADKQSVWLLCYRVKSGVPTISWSDAVDEALCFGWIDSTRKTVDDQSFIQFFCKRKAVSTWSKVNKEKVARLIEEGKMTAAGLRSIETAKQNGSWTVLDSVDALTVPADLEAAFAAVPGTQECFTALSRSAKKLMLYRLMSAKRPETRQKRIDEIVASVVEKRQKG